MWVCLNDAYLSAIQDKYAPNYLIVRARRKDHLENAFPDQIEEIFTKEGSDYPWRLSVSKKDFAHLLIDRVFSIDYENFKNSVQEKELHSFYNNVWWEGLFMQDVDTELTNYYKKAYYQRN